MTIASYTELVSELGSWLNRDDLTARIPTFIRLFEARMNRRLRSPDMEQSFTFTTVSGTTTYALSSRIRELRDAYLSISETDTTDPIDYSVIGENIVFADDPGSDLTVVYSGFTTLAGLTSGNATNWLLDDHPDIYLYGTLAEAYAHLRDDQAAALYKGMSDEALSEIMREANQKRMPAGPLRSAPAVIE